MFTHKPWSIRFSLSVIGFSLMVVWLAGCSSPTAPSGSPTQGAFGTLNQTVDGSDLEPFKTPNSCATDAPPISLSTHEGVILLKVAPYTHAEKVLTTIERFDSTHGINAYSEIGQLNADKPTFQLEYRPVSAGTYKVRVRWQVCGKAMQESVAVVTLDEPPTQPVVCEGTACWCESDPSHHWGNFSFAG